MKLFSNPLDGSDRLFGMRSPPAGKVLFEDGQEQLCLLSLASQMGKNALCESGSSGCMKNDLVGSPTGPELSGADRAIKQSANEFDRIAIAHAELDADTVSESVRDQAVDLLENGEASLAIHQAGNVSSLCGLHLNVQRLSLRGVEAKRPRNARHEAKSPRGDIVWSLLKDNAVTPFIWGKTVLALRPKANTSNIAPYIADDYVSIAEVTTFRGLKNSLETLHQYTETGLAHIFNGEIGRYESFRFIEQTFIPGGGAYDSTTFDPWTRTADAWNGAVSSWAFMMGADTVTEAVCVPEEIRAKIPGDYGRSRGIAWYYLGGFGLVHPDATNARVMMWDSAA